MDNPLSTAGAEALRKLVKAIEVVSDTAIRTGQEQLPDLAQQYLAWYLWRDIMGTVVGLVFVALAVFCITRWLHHRPQANLFYTLDYPEDQKYCGAKEAADGWCMAATGSAIVGFVFVGGCLSDVVKVWVAPKLVLLEGLRRLMQ